MQLAWLRDSWKESYCLSLAGAIYIQVCNVTLFLSLVLLCLPRKKSRPLVHGTVDRFFLCQHWGFLETCAVLQCVCC